MADHMKPKELKDRLNRPEEISKNSFVLLRELAQLFNSGDEEGCRDLVLHALEHRESFGGHTPILDGLVRELGLFPYVEKDQLPLTDAIAYEYHRPPNFGETFVFHREQAEVYRRLIDGDSIILSAPTSFGKSRIIDAIIASGRYRNIAVIVPTIALIDETRRRLSNLFPRFKVVTQVSQSPAAENIFVFTAERANSYGQFPKIDFFVIDEFYKIGGLTGDPKRTAALNQAFYNLSKGGAQFYLLGPCVSQIPDGFAERFRCRFYPTTFATVASDVIRVGATDDDTQTLCDLVRSLRGQPTLIYCRSPKRVNEVARALLESEATEGAEFLHDAAKWVGENFHPDWILPNALRRGVGIHHGKLPRSISQYVVRAFNDEKLSVLVCTSTLIEGVNTKAKNVIIFDNTIARQKFDFFTFNNIKGRSGRMFEHFVGRVFLFHEPPTAQLPFVDFPVFTQGPDTPDSVLVQMENRDLSEASKERMDPFMRQHVLPLEILRQHSSVEPSALLNLAERLQNSSYSERVLLQWSGFPKRENLKFTLGLIWDYLVPEERLAGVSSGSQLTVKIWSLMLTPEIRQRILNELAPGEYAAKSPDEAVERVLEFDRTWASFELPRLLRAFSDVRAYVLGGDSGYGIYAGQVENLFRKPFRIALEEFGLPLQIADKLSYFLDHADTIDAALSRIRELPTKRLGLSQFELELLADCQADL